MDLLVMIERLCKDMYSMKNVKKIKISGEKTNVVIEKDESDTSNDNAIQEKKE